MTSYSAAALDGATVHALQPRRGLRQFVLLLVVLAITAFPSNYVYYAAPVIVLMWSAISNAVVSMTRFAVLVVVLVLHTTLSLIANSLIGETNNYPALLFAIFTWLPIGILLCNRGCYWRIDDRQQHQIVVLLSGFVLVQAIVVGLQMTQTDNWDALAGSYGLLDFLGNITISQVFFTFNIFCINLYLLSYWRYAIAKMALVAGFLAVAAAQSGHQTVFFIGTLLLVYGSSRLRAWPRLIIAAAVLSGAVMAFFPQTPSLAVSWAERILFQEFPKSLVVLDSLDLLGTWKIALLGTGLGQFTSRASLFSSGEHLSVSLPPELIGASSYFTDVVEPLLALQAQVGEGSAIAKPYFSLLTVAVELGVVVSALGLAWIGRELWRARKLFKSKSDEVAGLARFQAGFLVFLFMCAAIENYFEFVQALMTPVLLYILAKGRVEYLLEPEHARHRPASQAAALETRS